MEKNDIIFIEDKKGGYVGWPKDRPDIIAEGETFEELLENVKELVESVKEYEEKQKSKK